MAGSSSDGGGLARSLLETGRDKLASAAESVGERLKRTTEAVRDAGEATKDTAEAAGETGARVRRELDVWTDGALHMLGLGAALGVAAIFALALITVAAVVWLDLWLGAPWGAAIVATVYALAAVFLARRRGTRPMTRSSASTQSTNSSRPRLTTRLPSWTRPKAATCARSSWVFWRPMG